MKQSFIKALFAVLSVFFMVFQPFSTVRGYSDRALAKKSVAAPSPSFAVSGGREIGSYWETGFEAVNQTLLKNLHRPNSHFKTRFAYPSPMFRGVYLWDTAFIAQVWKPWDPATAQDVNRAVLDHARNGRLQHYSSQWSRSDYTQPPVMAWSVWETYLWSGDLDYLARAYPVLKAYNRWLYDNRRLPCGLFHWIHSYESGIDNSPRFGSADESYMVDMPGLAAIDINSYLVRQNETLSKMALELGIPEEAETCSRRAHQLRELINNMMWDEETGYYYDLDTKSRKLNKIRTIASLFPLFAGVPDKDRAAVIRDHVMNPAEFNTKMPLPSVARDDPHFEKDCWRGPVWLNTAYMVIVGLERYGWYDEAAGLSWNLVDGVYRTYENTGRLVEFYDPDRYDFKELHRKKGNLYKQITLGGKPRPNFVGWTGLSNTILIQHLIGFDVNRGSMSIRPCFPDSAAGAAFSLELPGQAVTIDINVLDGARTKGVVRIDNRAREFELAKCGSMEL
jgi:glycogen debranching enzyme